MKNRGQLTAYERDMIGFHLSAGDSISSIAKILSRSKSTISDEVKRNSINGRYFPIYAQKISQERKSITNSLNPKIEDFVWDFVVFCLHLHWSPEQISGRIKYVLAPKTPSVWISDETIYARIYSDHLLNLKLFNLLPRKHSKRKFKYRKSRRSKIPDRISISQRRQEVNTREEFGHWEGDSVLGIRKNHGLHTEVERKSRLLRIKKVTKVNSTKTIKAQLQIFSELPEKARYSTTLDNGLEFVKHTKLKRLGVQVYFAHPYSSWERGTNEYHNGLIRRFYPKRTDFKRVTKKDLRFVENVINATPREILNFRTPSEVFEEEVKSESVRFRTWN